MATSKRPVSGSSKSAENKSKSKTVSDREIFEYELTVTPALPSDEIAVGPDSAAVAAALAQGWRPVGNAQYSVADHADGKSKVITWRVPVVPNFGEHAVEAINRESE